MLEHAGSAGADLLLVRAGGRIDTDIQLRQTCWARRSFVRSARGVRFPGLALTALEAHVERAPSWYDGGTEFDSRSGLNRHHRSRLGSGWCAARVTEEAVKGRQAKLGCPLVVEVFWLHTTLPRSKSGFDPRPPHSSSSWSCEANTTGLVVVLEWLRALAVTQ